MDGVSVRATVADVILHFFPHWKDDINRHTYGRSFDNREIYSLEEPCRRFTAPQLGHTLTVAEGGGYATPWGAVPVLDHPNPHLRVLEMMTHFQPVISVVSERALEVLSQKGGLMLDSQRGSFVRFSESVLRDREPDLTD